MKKQAQPAHAKDLAVGSRHLSTQTKMLLGSLLCISIMVVVTFLNYQTIMKMETASTWVDHTHRVLEAIDLAESTIKDAETGQRGYLLTGLEEYLDPHAIAVEQLQAQLQTLKTLTRDNPAQQRRVLDLERLSRQKLSELQETINLARQSERAKAMAIVLTNRGRTLMDQIRAVGKQIRAEESNLLATRQAALEKDVRNAVNMLLISIFLATLVLMVTAIYIARDARRYIHTIERSYQEVDELRIGLEREKEFTAIAGAAKTVFLKQVSHELLTPLTGILGFAQLLKLKKSKSGIDDTPEIDQILKSGARLQDLINDILEVSSLDDREASKALSEIPLSPAVHDSLATTKSLAEEKAINIETGNVDFLVIADPYSLKQVLIKLISNAIKYNHQGGTVRITAESISDDTLKIYVTDSGVGIHSADVKKLFTPFNRLSYAEENCIEGVGLGLSLCKYLVEKMGGVIEVESSQVNEGTCIAFTLALAPARHTNRRAVVEHERS